MGTLSIWHWLVVALVVLVFFGRGKIPELMGDVAKGIKSFKAGMREDEVSEADKAKKEIESQAATVTAATKAEPAKSDQKAG